MFRKRRSRVGLGVAVALLAPLALSACGGGSASGGSGGGSTSSGGTLNLGLLVPATTFQAPDMNWANESPYGQAVYDTLLQASPAGVVGPDLATAWSYNADKTVLTLTLKTGVKFTDGTAFNASTAAQNLEAFQKGTSSNAADLVNMASAKAVSPTQLAITLKQPDPAFLTFLTQNAGLQESPKAFSSSTAKTVPVGSGPYVMDHRGHGPRQLLHVHGQPELLEQGATALRQDRHDRVQHPHRRPERDPGRPGQRGEHVRQHLADPDPERGLHVYPLQLNWEGLLLLDRDGSMSKPPRQCQGPPGDQLRLRPDAPCSRPSGLVSAPRHADLRADLTRVQQGAGLLLHPSTRPKPSNCWLRRDTRTGSR